MTTSEIRDAPGGAALCRVSIVGGHTQVDLGLPSEIPLSALMPDVVALVESRAPERSELEPEPEDRTWHWVLAPVGREPIDPAVSLTEAGVRDGDLLVLERADSAQPPALFDDVIDAVATLQKHDERAWSAGSARLTGYALFLTVLAACLGVLWHQRDAGSSLVSPLAVAVVGLGMLVAATLATHVYGDRPTARVLGVGGLAAVAGGAGLALPADPAAAHLLLSAAIVSALSVPAMRVLDTGEATFTTTFTAGLLATFGAALALLTDLGLRPIGALLAAVALIVVSSAPRISIAASRLPIPPVPSAGEAIDPTDSAARPTIEGIGAVGSTTLPSATRLGERAARAGRFLTGVTAGGALAVTAGALLMLPGGTSYLWQSVALATVFGLVLVLRGRSHSDLVRAAVLVVSGTVVLAGVLVSLALEGRETTLAVGIALLLALALVALWSGVVVPRTDHTPTSRRMIEIVEYLLLAAIAPLLFWILGLYALVRNL